MPAQLVREWRGEEADAGQAPLGVAQLAAKHLSVQIAAAGVSSLEVRFQAAALARPLHVAEQYIVARVVATTSGGSS